MFHQTADPALSIVCKNIGQSRTGICIAKVTSIKRVEKNESVDVPLFEPIELPWRHFQTEKNLSAVLEPNESRKIWIAGVQSNGSLWIMRDLTRLGFESHQIFGPEGNYEVTLQVYDGQSLATQIVIRVQGRAGQPVSHGFVRGIGKISIQEQYVEPELLENTAAKKQRRTRPD